MRKIDLIVLHCTATSIKATRESIERYWRDVLGWKRPGYHYLIEADGKVHVLQPHAFPSNGVAGHNANSIHISYIGGLDDKGKPADTRTRQQRTAIQTLLDFLLELYPEAKVAGHYQLGNKACPCFDVPMWLQHIRVPLNRIFQNGRVAPVKGILSLVLMLLLLTGCTPNLQDCLERYGNQAQVPIMVPVKVEPSSSRIVLPAVQCPDQKAAQEPALSKQQAPTKATPKAKSKRRLITVDLTDTIRLTAGRATVLLTASADGNLIAIAECAGVDSLQPVTIPPKSVLQCPDPSKHKPVSIWESIKSMFAGLGAVLLLLILILRLKYK